MSSEVLWLAIPLALIAAHGFCGYKLARWNNGSIAILIAVGWGIVSGWFAYEMSVARGWDGLLWFMGLMGVSGPSLLGLGGGYLSGVMSRPDQPSMPAE